MSQPVNGAIKAMDLKAKLPNVLFVAVKLALVTGIIHTLVEALRIWGRPLSGSMLLTLGASPEPADLLAYRMSMLGEAAAVNFLSWFATALVVVFISRQLKGA